MLVMMFINKERNQFEEIDVVKWQSERKETFRVYI